MKLCVLIGFCVLSLLALFVAPSAAQTACELEKLTAFDPSLFADFGSAVHLDGDIAIVGAKYDDQSAVDAGAAYVFRFSGIDWELTQKLYASNATANDEFGSSVVTKGDIAVVGAVWSDTNGLGAGSVYVFRFVGNSWMQVQELVAPDASPGDRFGHSVGMATGSIVVSSLNTENGGAAYIFSEESGAFAFEQKLVASDANTGDEFGSEVAITDEVVIVGAPRNDSVSDNSGAAYIFRKSAFGWTEEQKLIGSDIRQESHFGASTAISSDCVIIGAPRDDETPSYGIDTGAAYIFCYVAGVWSQVQRFQGYDLSQGSMFGTSVSLTDGIAMVGAPKVGMRGAAYIFQSTGGTWSQTQKLVSADIADGDTFGSCARISGKRAIVSAPADTHSSIVGAGSTYVFAYAGDCNTNDVADECDIWTGVSVDCNGNNIPDECDIPAGTSFDCNSNSIPDECDLACSQTNQNAYVVIAAVTPPGHGNPNVSPALRFTMNGSEPLESQPNIPPAYVFDPAGVAFNRQGELFVGNRHGNSGPGSISRFKFDGCGNWQSNGQVVGNGLEAVHQVGFSPSTGELFAMNYWANSVSRFVFDQNANAVPNGVVSVGLPVGIGLAVSPSGELFASGGGSIHRFLFDEAGGPIDNGILPYETGSFLYFDQEGALWFGLGQSLMRCTFDSSGYVTCVDVPGVDVPVMGIAITPSNELLISTHGAGGISRFVLDASGTAISNGFVATESLGGIAVLDLCSIESLDCNANSVPDECDINIGAAPDCNSNGVPDSCDIGNGTSLDADATGVPDECEVMGACCATDSHQCAETTVLHCSTSWWLRGASCNPNACFPPPLVVPVGSRYLAITPDAENTFPVALLVTSTDFPCLHKYIDANGLLLDSPTYRTASQWGTALVGDDEIVPNSNYEVGADDGTIVSGLAAATWRWGDTDNNTIVNLDDILCVLAAFAGNFTLTCSLHSADQIGGFFNPDRVVNLDDILAVLNAFSGGSYPGANPCP